MAAPMPTMPLTPTPMSLTSFNAGPTLAWSLIKAPNWATRMQRAVSGREVRVSDFTNPLWNFTLTWEVLRDAWDLRDPTSSYGHGPAFPIGYSPFYELDNIVQFFNSVQGAHIAFQWLDPTDNDTSPLGPTTPSGAGSGVNIGLGDGLTKAFRIIGHQGGPVIPNVIRWVLPNSISYTIDNNNALIVFSSAPNPGIAIQMGFTYFQRVRFKNDSFEAEEFMYQLWSIKKIELMSALW